MKRVSFRSYNVKLRDDLLQVRCPGVVFYVLRQVDGLVLIDTGFIAAQRCLEKALREHGWQDLPIQGIILTHGHLDHILNAGALAKQHGAWIAAPKLDRQHYLGTPRYTGWSRVTGMMETIGRPLLGFQPFTPDRFLDDGDTLDVWHGLRAIHLPGHTAGQMGYYCEKLGLMFTGDSFASFHGFVHYAPAIFSASVPKAKLSAKRVLDFDLKGVLPHHCDEASAEEHLERLRRLCDTNSV